MGCINRHKQAYTEELIQKRLGQFFMSQSNIKFLCENLFVYNWESDLLFFTKSGYVYEMEIKITKSDFKNDFKNKGKKHLLLESETDKNIPNYFYYAVPENLISIDEVPEYAGLIYMVDYYPYYKIVKTAPKKHKEKYSVEGLKLLEKFYWNYRDWKNKAKQEKDNNIFLNEEIDKLTEKPVEERKTYNVILNELECKTSENINLKNEIESLRKSLNEKYKDIRFDNYYILELKNILKDNNIQVNYSEIDSKTLKKTNELWEK